MPESRPLRPGDPDRVGPYRLTGFLGRGGQGAVYLGRGAEDPAAPVAVKVLDTEWAADPRYRQRFEREAAAARRVASFCTAQVLDADVDAERPYIVSEYVPGGTLRDDVLANGPRSGSDLHRLAVATATALVAIHEAGVVHRDFKPGNVLLAPDGARVIDFGIARAVDIGGTSSQTVIGTPGYMAPEQIAGDGAGPAADVFAWGAVVFFAATGDTAFGGDSIPQVMHRILHTEPDLGAMGEEWRGLVAECLSKDPAGRPSSADLLLRLLGRRTALPADVAPGGADPAGTASAAPATGTAAPATGATGTDAAATAAGTAARRPAHRLAAGAALAAVVAIGAGAAWVYAAPGPAPGPGQQGAEAAATGGPGGVESGRAVPGPGPGPAASGGADAKGEQKRGDKGPSPSPSGSGPAFRAAFAGDWSGAERDGGGARSMSIAKGDTAVRLASGDRSCTWTFRPVRATDRGGYNAEVTSDRGCGPHTTASLWLPQDDPDRLTVHLHGVPGHHEARWVDLDRA